jgi:hypothetical protein
VQDDRLTADRLPSPGSYRGPDVVSAEAGRVQLIARQHTVLSIGKVSQMPRHGD